MLQLDGENVAHLSAPASTLLADRSEGQAGYDARMLRDIAFSIA